MKGYGIMTDKYYKINEETGELEEVKGTVVESGSGDRIIRKNTLDYLKKQSARREDSTDFVWVFFNYNTPLYSHVQAANLTRLMYFATFCAKDGYVMRNLDIKSTLLINANQIKAFRDELFDGIIINNKGNLFLKRNCFCKGELGEESQNYIRLFTQSTRELYESCDTSAEHKSLSYIFKMIPYVNRQTNILCINQQEQVIDSVQKMSFSDYCEYLDFDKSHASRLRNRLLNYRIDGELAVGFFDDLERLSFSGKYVVVNPILYYGGDRTQLNYSNIRKLFIDEKNEFSSSRQ